MNPSSYLSRVFGQSPVRPLQQHIENAANAAGKLPEFLQAAQADDWEKAAEVRREIVELEHAADDLKRELRLNLPRSLFMPVARSDVLEMLSVQDRIANKARDISGLMLGRKMRFPDALEELYMRFAQRSLDAVRQAHETVNELDELFETGFRGNEIDVVMAMIDKLDDIENDGDRLQVELRGRLFGLESDLPPIDVMFYYKVIDWTGDLGDLALRVGSRLHLMMAR